MSGKAARVSIRVPAVLLARAREEAARCGVTVAQFLSQITHSALAERCCQHAASPAEPPAPSEPAEDDGA